MVNNSYIHIRRYRSIIDNTPCNYVATYMTVLFYTCIVMFFIEWRRLLQSSQNDSEQLQHSAPVHNKVTEGTYVTAMQVRTYSYVCDYCDYVHHKSILTYLQIQLCTFDKPCVV